jgi:ribose transport system ATP-binding protein
MSTERAFLEMRGIVKQFPGVRALNGVSLDVCAGEVHLVLGENGAGKSTLIKVLSGVYTPDAGEILVEGQVVRIHHPRDAQALGISTIHQEFNLAPDLSAAENIFLGREPMLSRALGLVDRGALMRQTRQILASLDLRVPADAKVKDLGVAQQQMVEIARALSLESRLIVMDEPTAALTSREIDRLFATIRELKNRGVAIVYISHRLDEVKALGDRATILRDGSLVGTVAVAKTPIDELIRLMVGRDLRDTFPKADVAPGEDALRVEHLTRAGVLHDVSFHVRRGEILGLAGLVGAKRTETARAIFGADPLDGGRILVHGTPVAIGSPRDAIRHRIALIPEDRKRQGILASMSVRENITLSSIARFARAGVVDIGAEQTDARAYATALRVAPLDLERQAVYLSGGNQQKVVIAKWLSTHADVFLFDEPTRGIDVAAKVEVYQLMGDLVRRGAAIIMISSELPEILGMSDRIIVMRDGRVAAEFERRDATEERILECALRSAPVPSSDVSGAFA